MVALVLSVVNFLWVAFCISTDKAGVLYVVAVNGTIGVFLFIMSLRED